MRALFNGPLSLLLCAILLGFFFVVDLHTPLGMADGILYISVVLASFWVPSRRVPFFAAGVCTGLIILELIVSPPGNALRNIANRLLVLFVLWALTLLVTGREGALIEAEERYRDLIGSVHAIVWRGDTKTSRFTFVSWQAETILGFPVRRWIDEETFWQSQIIPDDRERVLGSYAEATSKGGNHQFNYRMTAADGRVIWFRDYVRIVMQDGQPKEAIGVMVDITEQKLAEQAVRNTEARYRILAEVSPDAIFVHREGRLLFVNERGLRLLRAPSVDQVIGRPMREFFSQDVPEMVWQRLCGTVDPSGPAGMLEARIVCLDRTLVDVEVNAIRIDDAGMPAIQVVLRDITNRRQAELEREILIHTLGERVKELALLQKVTGLFQSHDMPFDEIMRNFVSLIPMGWQYPHICGVEVVVDSVVYASEHFRLSPWILREDISFGGRVRGKIAVVYVEKPADGDEAPFLEEERSLIKALAEQCALCLEGRYTAAALKRSETLSRESAERTRLMMDALPVLVTYVDRQHRCRENNAEYRRWFGEAQASLQGHHLQDVLGPTAYEAFRPKIDAALRGESVEFETELSDGMERIRSVHVTCTPHRDVTGEVVGVYALLQDIFARKQTEESLKRNEERLRNIVSVLAEGVLLHASTGTVIACNPSAERILGLSAEQMIGRTWLDSRWRAIREDGSPCLPEQHPAMYTLRTGEPCRNVVLGIGKPGGELRWLSINTKPLLRKDDVLPDGVVSSFQDITERKHAEATLQKVLVELEMRVTERTTELQKANAALREEMVQRQEIEAALRRSESGLAEAQRIAHMGSWEFDILENRVDWSDGTHLIFEADPAQFNASYESFLSFVHPEDRELVDQAYIEAIRNRTPYEIVHRLLMSDGRTKYVLERCETFYDADGTPLRSIGTVQDITQRILVEKQLQRSEERYRVLYEDNPSMYFTVDPEGIVLSVNRFGAEQLGYFPEDLVGCSVLLVVHPEDHARACEQLGRCARNPGKVWNWEFRKKRKDGSILWVQETARSEQNPDGRLVLFIVCENITARKQAEAALNAAHAELEERVAVRTAELSEINQQLRREIIERERAELALKSRDAILEAVGFAARQLMPCTSWSEQVSKVLAQLGYAADADRLCLFKNLRRENGELEVSLYAEWIAPGMTSQMTNPELRGVAYVERGLGRWRDLLGRGLPVYGLVKEFPPIEQSILTSRGLHSVAMLPIFAGQEWWGFLACGVVRSERVWLTSDLEALQVAASTLGAAMQRERMEEQIRLYTEELEDLVSRRTYRIKELEAQRAQAEKLAALGQLAAGVAHEINNPIAGIKNAFLVLKDGISREHPNFQFVGMIEREIERVASIVRRMYDLYRKESQQEQVIALNTLIEDCSYLLKPKLIQRKVTLQASIASTIPPVRLVQRDLLQVVLNLVQNAVEASPDGGVIDINITHDQDHVRISVSDRGNGIGPDELPHIFEPFFSGMDKRKKGGMGLGLSVSYSLVHAMEGTIEVVSHMNKGSTFTVVLPLARVARTTVHFGGEPQ